MASPSTSMGSKDWMPNRCSVGARFSITGCSLITCSSASQTSGRPRSTIFLALLMVATCSLSLRSFRKMNGLNNSSAIFLGRPH